MTKNKAYLVNQLCALRGLDPESDKGKELYSLKIIELLTEIKHTKPEPPKENVKKDHEEDEYEDDSLARRLGCT
jgi:hypothetical protein